jgi:deoxyribodipyrimidine photo-lyase
MDGSQCEARSEKVYDQDSDEASESVSVSYHAGMIHGTRLRLSNDLPIASDRKYVLYWMQASQRTRYNHALEHAIQQANTANLPVIVCFGLMDEYLGANARHYAFLLQGLKEVEKALEKRNIRFVVRHGKPPAVALSLAKQAALVVCDRGYARYQKLWRETVAHDAPCRVVEVETDVIVPVEQASPKQEFAARTIRPKLHKQWPTYLVDLSETKVKHSSLKLRIPGDIDVSQPEKALAKLKLDHSVLNRHHFIGGQSEAAKRLQHFVTARLKGYDEGRNEPAAGHTSTLSAYLHFGQISPLEIILAVREANGPQADRDSFIEELGIRRELAINFTHYSPKYDSYEGLPEWSRKTLSEHRGDKRYHIYSRQELEAAATHDPYWNAAQKEMNATGFMHNYMRMYWGKRVLEWSRTPQEAYETLLYLNDKLFLCGRDPNGWTNVGWIFGLHDRPWGPQRPIFGLVRYMNSAGLERKFDMQAYVEKVNRL